MPGDRAMREIITEIAILASAESVWRILTDFDDYPQWNPFIRRIQGEATPGSRPEVSLQPAGGQEMTFRPTVLTAEPSRELRWLGHLLIFGLFDGEHIFTIEPIGANRVRFIQR